MPTWLDRLRGRRAAPTGAEPRHKLVPLGEHDAAKRISHVTDGRVLTGQFDLQALSQTCLDLEAETPGHVCLATLDNLGQADYTSMHAVNAHDLDDTKGHDLSGLPETVFEDGQHVGYLSTEAEFPIRLANFRARTFPLLDKVSTVPWSSEEADLDTLNRDPSTILDPVSVLRLVPVTNRADVLAAYPNGYFTCDLSPFDIHTLASHLEATYGYQLFGIGASYLAFRRVSTLDRAQKASLSNDIARLYDAPDRAEQIQAWLDRPFLILRYTE